MMTRLRKKAPKYPGQPTLFDTCPFTIERKGARIGTRMPVLSSLHGDLAGGIAPRLYQEAIAASSMRKGKDGRQLSTFVIMPTGLGKTLIAFLATPPMLEKGKVLFIAPTGTLVHQHVKEAHEMLLSSEVAGIVGTEMPPEMRAAIYASGARFIIATAHAIANDIEAGRLSLDGFSLLISDEAQHSVGDHPHNKVASAAIAASVPIMALSASPGDSVQRVFEVMRNLGIGNVEIRTVHDDDVAPYVQSTEVINHFVELTWLYKLIGERLREISNGAFEKLHKLGYLRGVGGFGDFQPDIFGVVEAAAADYSRLLKFSAIGAIERNIGRMPKNVGKEWLPDVGAAGSWRKMRGISLCKELEAIIALISLFETEGLHAGLAYAKKNIEGAIGGDGRRKRYAQRIWNDTRFKRMYKYLTDNIDKPDKDAPEDALETEKDEYLRENPKVYALEDLVLNDARLPRSKPKIIFCKYREQAKYLMERLERAGIPTGVLLGKKDGFTSKNQLEALEGLRSGRIEALVCTPAGEEGIDMPNAIVINFDQVGSSLRSIQRKGRTSRTEPGVLVNIIAEGTMDVGLFHKSYNAREKMDEAARAASLLLG